MDGMNEVQEDVEINLPLNDNEVTVIDDSRKRP